MPVNIVDHKPLAELRHIVSIYLVLRKMEEHEMLNEFAVNLHKIVDKWGGYFSRISFGDKGGTVLINFGIPVSYEDNLHRALMCIQEIKSIYTGSVRAGVTMGRLFTGIMGSQIRASYAVLGDAVNLSARMAMKCPWGSVWIGENMAITGSRNFRIDYVDDFIFKGISRQVKVFELKHRAIPKPRSFTGPFFGRENEIKALNDYIMQVFQGRFAGVVYIYGNAGIGKTRFIDEVLCRYEELHVCHLQCDGIIKRPWNPVVFFLSEYFGQNKDSKDKDKKFEKIFEKLVNDLSNNHDTRAKDIIKELKRTKSSIKALLSLNTKGTLYEDLSAKNKYMNAIYAATEIYKALSICCPLVIKLEDIHWIDDDSIFLLKYLSRNIRDYPIIILCTSRFKDDGSKPVLDVEETVKSSSIILGLLDDDSLTGLAREKFGASPDAGLFSFIKQRANGNPFYAEQFCLYLKENGFVYSDGNRYALSERTEGIPLKISQVLVARIDRLSRDLRELIKIAAVIGQEFNKHILAEAVQMIGEMLNPDEKSRFDMIAIRKMLGSGVASCIDSGSTVNIWSKFNELMYVFSHSLLQKTAYDMQLSSRLRIIHYMVAVVMEGLVKSNEDIYREFYQDLAYHYEKAEKLAKATEYLEKSGKYLKDTYKNSEALDAYARLLGFLENREKILKVKIDMGSICSLAGRWEEAERIFKQCKELAEEINMRNLLAVSLHSIGSLNMNRGLTKDALYYYDQAMQINREIGNTHNYLSNIIEIGHVYLCFGNHARALEYINMAEKLVEECGDKKAAIGVQNSRGDIYHDKGQYEKALECYNFCIRESAKDVRYMDILGSTLGNIGNVYLNMGDYEKALGYYKKAGKIFGKIGQKQKRGITAVNMGIICFIQGLHAKSMEYFEIMREISAELGDIKREGNSLLQMGNAYTEMGKYEMARKKLVMSKTMAEKTGDKYGVLEAMNSIGVTYMLEHKFDKAIDHFITAKKMAEELGNKHDIARTTGNIGQVYLDQGLFDRALSCFNTFLGISEEIGGKLGVGIAKGKIGMIHFEMNEFDVSVLCINKALKLLSEISFKDKNIIEWLLVKARIFLRKGNIKEANKCIKKAQELGNELNKPDYVLKAIVQKHVVHSVTDKKASAKALRQILKKEISEEQTAGIYYELYFIERKEADRISALHIYSTLYKAAHLFQYKKRLDQLAR